MKKQNENITDASMLRQKAEELLEQTHQNYETFFNTIDEFLFVLDEQGNILHVNSAVIERLGYTFDELVNKSVLLLHPSERRDEAGRIVAEMLMGITEICPVPIVTKSGIQIPVETKVKQGVWDGKPVIFGVSKDISNLKFSEEKFSKLFHINPSACGLSNLETHEFVEVNQAFYDLFGYDKDEVIGETAYSLGIFTTEAAKAVLLLTDSKGNITNAEADLRTKNGTIKHTLVSSENIYVQDKKYRFTVVNDITDRIISEKALKKSEEELRQLNVTKDKFFSIIAHDLKSPFHSIMGFSELLVEQVRKQDYDGMIKFAEIILNSSHRAVDLLMNLMEWSRSQTGRMEFNPENIEMVEFINEMIPMFDDIARQKSIVITQELPLNAAVFADQAMINTVLRNLISNAIKFTMPGGEIVISVAKKPNEITVSVKDSGIGISADRIDKLFHFDESYSTPGTNNEKGTGLGLILCKEFVEKHGGRLWVESEQGKGSTFSFEIPAGYS